MYYCFLEFPFGIVQHIDKVLMLIKEGNRLHGVSFIKDDGDCSFSTIDCIVNRSVVHRAGTLFFTNKSMVFISSPNEDYSIIIDYEAIGVHAICHSSDIYVHACVYCQVSDTNDDSSYFICHSPGSLCEGEDFLCQSDEGELSNSTHIEEVLFSPEDASLIEILFDQISLYQSKNEESQLMDEDVLQSNGEIAFDCNVEELFLQADEDYRRNSQE